MKPELTYPETRCVDVSELRPGRLLSASGGLATHLAAYDSSESSKRLALFRLAQDRLKLRLGRRASCHQWQPDTG